MYGAKSLHPSEEGHSAGGLLYSPPVCVVSELFRTFLEDVESCELVLVKAVVVKNAAEESAHPFDSDRHERREGGELGRGERVEEWQSEWAEMRSSEKRRAP